jgi:dsRNA-specific ribonuclease
MQKYCQQIHHYTPIYKMVSSENGEFKMNVCTPDGTPLGTGVALTKKTAEQLACKEALQKWGVI